MIFGATSSATCPGNDCTFSFVAPVATLTGLTAAHDATTNTIQVTAVGTGFTSGDTTSVSLYIDNVKQTTLSVASATEAVFTITDIADISSTNVRVYFADGYSNGWSSYTSLTFTYNFVQVSPNTGGSEGGTLLTVIGTGFGTKTTGLDLKDTTTNKLLCKKVTITGYGTFTCLTNAEPVAATDTIKLVKDTTLIDCANTDATKCKFT